MEPSHTETKAKATGGEVEGLNAEIRGRDIALRFQEGSVMQATPAQFSSVMSDFLTPWTAARQGFP